MNEGNIPDNATAADSLLKTSESKQSAPEVEVSEEQALTSPESKAEVKYVSADSKNGDAKIDIENVRAAFAGMGKEELLRFANDPFWIRTRMFLFVLFWVLWLAMLAGAIAIIVLAPKCAAPKPRDWYERSPLYEINVGSFKDGSSRADGVGDLEGLKSKLEYFVENGIEGVILSSIFPTGSSSELDSESVLDFYNVHADYGTIDDVKNLTESFKQKGIHVVLDMVPNHSGTKNEWFKKSVKREAPYSDYYVWASGKASGQKDSPPNNWKSLSGGSAWQWNDERNDFYLHQFGVEQPDLNFRNLAVQEEFNKIFKFWLNLGVTGFHLRKTSFLFEDELLRDELIGNSPGTTHDNYDFYMHKYTSHLHESLGLVGKWRSFVTNSSEENVLLVQDEFPVMDLAHNEDSANSSVGAYNLLQTPEFPRLLTGKLNITEVAQNIKKAINRAPNGWPVWRLGDKETSRLASRFPPGIVDALLMTVMLLPGTPIVYYGDEIGLTDLPNKQFAAVSPMQWNSSMNGGFTLDSIKPVHDLINAREVNVDSQEAATESRIKIFKELISTRKTSAAIMYGTTNVTVLNASVSEKVGENRSVLAITCIKSGNPGVLVMVNPHPEECSVDFGPLNVLAQELTVTIKSENIRNKDLQVKSKVPKDGVKLPPESGIVFTFVYKED